MTKKKALIAMSGGVDSSVAAKLMIDAGYDCIGCNMRLYDLNTELAEENSCCSLEDVEDARAVAQKLGMPFYAFNFKDGFKEKIIDKFVCSYERGLTPNPCIDCNRYMKFDALYRRAEELGCNVIVTGHYVRIEEKDGEFFLKKAVDPSKDQSYVLYTLTQEQLAHTMFPLGSYTKAEARVLAEKSGFLNYDKSDSQDICFVPDGDYAKVIRQYSGKEYAPGDFVDAEGNVLGQHKGIIHYTIGQRRGLGLSLKEPMYVCRLDVPNNKVVLGRNEDLFRRDVTVRDANWISGQTPQAPFHCKAKLRYRQEERPALCTPEGKNGFRLLFDEPQRAVTPGQAAVLYDGDIVLGGGTIV